MNRTPKMTAKDFDELRLITKVVTLYYRKGLSQTDIARQLNLSPSKVNRLFAFAHENGIVDIKIRTPLELTFELESRLEAIFDIKEAVIVPAVLDDAPGLTEAVGAAAATYLDAHLRDGDVVVCGGGTTLLSMVRSLDPDHPRDVTVVPFEGGYRSNDIVTDINFLVSELARKLGGRMLPLHAPSFVDTLEQKEMLMGLSEVKFSLDVARNASVAVVGMGTCTADPTAERSRFSLFTGLSAEECQRIREECGGVGEIAGRIFDINGKPTATQFSDRIVGLSLEELKAIPLSIGVAATTDKALAIYGALKGGYFDVFITDELAAQGVLAHFGREFREKTVPAT